MSTITVGGIGFGNATPAPGGGGTITGATNGLQVIGGVNIGLGGTMNLMTTIQTSNSSVLTMIPTAGEQNALLVVGSATGYDNSSYFNAIGDFFGAFPQKAMFISDKTVNAPGDGVYIYFDSTNNALQVQSGNNVTPATINITNTNLVIGTNNEVTNSPLEIHGDGSARAQIALFDTSVFVTSCLLEYNETDNLFKINTQNSPTGLQVNGNNFLNPDSTYNTVIGSTNPLLGFSQVEIISDPVSKSQLLLGDKSTNQFVEFFVDTSGSVVGTPSLYISPSSSISLVFAGVGLRSASYIIAGSTSAADSSAVMQANSITQGFLPPRMTTVQKLAISSPAAGLLVYDTTLNQMSYYNNATWINF